MNGIAGWLADQTPGFWVVVSLGFVVGLLALVWYCAALSALLERLGADGWRAWVPLMGEAEVFERGGVPGWSVAYYFIPGVAIWGLVLRSRAVHRINVSFGRGVGATVLGVVLPPVWASVVGWSARTDRTPRARVATSPAPVPSGAVQPTQVDLPLSALGTPGPPPVAPSPAPPVAPSPAPPVARPTAPPPVPPRPAVAEPVPVREPAAVTEPVPVAESTHQDVGIAELMGIVGAEPASSQPAPPPQPAPPQPAPPPPPLPPPPPPPPVAPVPSVPASQDTTVVQEDWEGTVVLDRPAATTWWLVLADGRRFELEGQSVVVGRQPVVHDASVHALAIPDDTRTLSKKHARFTWDNGWFVTDLNSTNGIVLRLGDGERALGPGETTRVEGGLLLGSLEVEIRELEEDPS